MLTPYLGSVVIDTWENAKYIIFYTYFENGEIFGLYVLIVKLFLDRSTYLTEYT